MPKNGLTEILCVLDKSGSMSGLTDETISGFNKFVADQKACPGDARLTLTLFDTEYKIVHQSIPIGSVPKLNRRVYDADGYTALLDALGRTINECGNEFDRRPEWEKPEKVIVLVMTDGQENASKEYNKQQVKALVEQQQRDWHWQFTFIGAEIDAIAEASSIGIFSNVASNSKTARGVQTAYAAVSTAACLYRADTTGDDMHLDSTSVQ